MKTITEMAREAGIEDAYFHKPHTGVMAQLERFAELVRADEREAMLGLVDGYAKNNTELRDAIRARSQA